MNGISGNFIHAKAEKESIIKHNQIEIKTSVTESQRKHIYIFWVCGKF